MSTPGTSSTMTTIRHDATTRVALVLSLVSMFLAGWSFLASFDDERDTEQLEQRLACLELPGANDCGADGR